MIRVADFSMFGPADFKRVRVFLEKLEKDNTGYKRGPQKIFLDDTNGNMWIITRDGNKIMLPENKYYS